MNMRMLLRMAMMARRRPSAARIKLVLGVLALSAVLIAIEQMFGWPEALTFDKMPRR
ncbi:hypothetical protein [Candidatus Halocynthiibacter alkanivorans]|uniref:hypothetical protein n=1 Tax=Candidatus Halocynthiibacter alkanivorans TaxID=2267619 RepID=UPI00190F7A8D|nr:hypothetical protein [Candidatus Halocynthiibacter alkanivorans]